MKNVAFVAALVLATTTASIRAADACGSAPAAAPVRFADRVAAYPGAKAHGVWPRVERDGARAVLTLSYPRFGAEGPQLYMDSFEVVRDRNLRRLEAALAGRKLPDLDVTIERVDGRRWRIVSWSSRA
ncbi:MAG: hypothetical protein K8M05_08030 [Deltaproteobacteria bacterium]|nr:hypothetical protein [Kofleriaceae bacterium]